MLSAIFLNWEAINLRMKIICLISNKKKYMNKILIESSITSAINLISNELEPLIEEDLRSEIEIVLAQLELALKELKKE